MLCEYMIRNPRFVPVITKKTPGQNKTIQNETKPHKTTSKQTNKQTNKQNKNRNKNTLNCDVIFVHKNILSHCNFNIPVMTYEWQGENILQNNEKHNKY